MKPFRLFALIAALLLPLTPFSAFAASGADLKAATDDTVFYAPEDDCGGTGTTTTTPTPTGSDNWNANVTITKPADPSISDGEQAVWDLLKGQGLTDAQAAGIMGNVDDESGFDPRIIQSDGDSNDPNAAGGGGWGLFQWTPGGKVLTDFKGFNIAGSITDIPAQVHIWWEEFQGKGLWTGHPDYLTQLRAVTGNDVTAVVNATAIQAAWESGDPGSRIAFAKGIFAQAATLDKGANGAGAGGTGGSTTTSSSNCCDTASSSGASGSGSNSPLGTFSSLTGKDAISGTFVLGFDVSDPAISQTTIEDVFKKYKPAGIFILGTSDAASKGYGQSFFQGLAVDAGHPIITSSDEEGWVTRYQYNPAIPTAGAMSKMSASAVTGIANQAGQQMASNGINTDLAPVLDIGTDIGSHTDVDFHDPGPVASGGQDNRTFGTDAATVTSHAGAFADGLSQAGVKPVFKHFPGLGSSTGNTDLGPVTSPNLTYLTSHDLVPYKSLANKDGAAVMMDNAHVPGLTGPGEVASTSAAAVSLLAHQYSFTGLVTTDDLGAKGVGQPIASAVAMSLAAGVDAPLFKYTTPKALDDAISTAQAAPYKVNTTAALALLDSFVPNSLPSSGGSCCNPTATPPSSGGGGLVHFYDSTDPKLIPDLTHAATYTTNYINGHTAIGIAQSADEATDIAAAKISNALDMEAGAADYSWSADWVKARSKYSSGIYILYFSESAWPAVKSSIATLPADLQSHVRYWLANWSTGATVEPGAWGHQYLNDGQIYDESVTTTSGWAEVLASPPGGSGGGVSGGSSCSTGSGTTGGLVDPFSSWIPNRLDMGYDGTFKDTIVAPFAGTVTYASTSFSNWGGWVEIKASAPIHNWPSSLKSSSTLYFAEGVKPLVASGKKVNAGDPIAANAPSPYGDPYGTAGPGEGEIEWGVAQDGPVGTPTNTFVYGQCHTTAATQAVLDFAKWAEQNLNVAPPATSDNAGCP